MPSICSGLLVICFYNIWHRSLAIFNKKEIIMQYTAHTTLDTSKCKYEIHSSRQLQHHQSMHQFQTAALYSRLYLVHGNWWISASSINCSLIHHCCVSVYIFMWLSTSGFRLLLMWKYISTPEYCLKKELQLITSLHFSITYKTRIKKEICCPWWKLKLSSSKHRWWFCLIRV